MSMRTRVVEQRGALLLPEGQLSRDKLGDLNKWGRGPRLFVLLTF